LFAIERKANSELLIRAKHNRRVNHELRFVKEAMTQILTRKLGELPQDVLEQIETLSLEQLENLGEALLDFTSMND
jgi:hypothetical protein